MEEYKSLTVAGPYKTKRKACAVQRAVQKRLVGIWRAGGPYQGQHTITLEGVDLPVWTKSVYVGQIKKKFLGVKTQFCLVARSTEY